MGKGNEAVPFSALATAKRCAIDLIVDQEGTLACDHAVGLCLPTASTRDLADAVHALCHLHGAAPSLVTLAASPDTDSALERMAAAFDAERAMLATVTAAVGPIPSTPRHAQSEAAITTQRHALATLAQSARMGCAGGAALALLLDWHAVRAVLTAAAARANIAVPPSQLPSRATILAAAQDIATDPSRSRALAFGAQQLAVQHHGLWRLLAARAEARSAL